MMTTGGSGHPVVRCAPLAEGATTIDLHYLGRPGWIASALLEGEDGPALVDPGPATSLENLRAALAERGLAVTDLRTLLLTHIHLDHAGATGSLVRENPALRVYVHERGARHLADPSRLLESARRIYRERMDELWGEFLPVPPSNLEALAGGETIAVAGRRIETAYTPGHASHHLSFLDTRTGIAFTGDVAGIRLGNRPFALPPAPPPDIDVEGWRASLAKIRAWAPQRLFVTHFGPADGVAAHLDELEARLLDWAERVRRSLDEDASDEARADRFTAAVAEELRHHLPADDATAYFTNAGIRESWYGLARYWRRRGGGGG